MAQNLFERGWKEVYTSNNMPEVKKHHYLYLAEQLRRLHQVR